MPKRPTQNPRSLNIGQAIQQAVGLQQQGKLKDAERLYRAVLKLRPDHFDALHLLGVLRGQQGDHEAAIKLISLALSQNPRSAEAHSNLGIALYKLNRYGEALASFDGALAIKPEYADALKHRASTLMKLNRHREAIVCYDRVLGLSPSDADALKNRGYALATLGHNEEAVASFDHALAIKPDDEQIYVLRGSALARQRRHEEAALSYEKALLIKPDFKYALGQAAHFRAFICDWAKRDQAERLLVEEVRLGRAVIRPFAFLAVSHSPVDQLICSVSYVHDSFSTGTQIRSEGARSRHKRIRVSYLSADFDEHAMAYLLAGLFERHDRARFEVYGISFGPDKESATRSRLMRGFERFIDVREKSDEEVVKLLRELEIDIAVDLMGYTDNSRPDILAHRPAPIQVNYLGYPGTMGADFIDYIIADEFVIPRSEHHHYSEKVVYLPDCFQANDSKRKIGERTPMRTGAGLPESGLVFCCFNNSYKIKQNVFDVWMRILRRVEDSVLWLLGESDITIANLRREAQSRGVEPDRLVFAKRVKAQDYLARYRLADLFLDTLPFSAGTTASDALWAGVPLVTCAGAAFAARMAGSLLHAVGLPELVTYNLEDYEALILKLATDENLLRAVKEKLARNRLTEPLFDTDRFRRHIEAAYTTMWDIEQRGEEPRSFAVPPVR